MELRAEDGSGHVDDALVAAVVEVDKVLFPIPVQGRGVDGVAVVLRCDVAPPRCEIQRGDVVCTVAVFQFDGLCPRG